jgi:hypothetical protein
MRYLKTLWRWLNHHDLCPCGLAWRINRDFGGRVGRAWCERIDGWAAGEMMA